MRRLLIVALMLSVILAGCESGASDPSPATETTPPDAAVNVVDPTSTPEPAATATTQATTTSVAAAATSPSPTHTPSPMNTPEPTNTPVATSMPLPTNTPEPTATPDPFAGMVLVPVSRVIDGDTIEIEYDGQLQPVRIIGVDTPETVHPSEPEQCYGAEATAFAIQMIDLAGWQVYLEKDVSETDHYGRLLRYVWLPHADGNRMLNQELVAQGYAQVSTYPPDVKHQDIFLDAQRAARNEGRGLWGSCGGFGVPLAQPTPTPIPAAPPPPPATSDMDCADFASQADAQSFYEAAGGPAVDPHGLDADRDGIACEVSPAQPNPPPPVSSNCDPSYPDVCIAPYPPDLDCGEISYRRFTVVPPDPHGFDADNDGVGCESG